MTLSGLSTTDPGSTLLTVYSFFVAHLPRAGMLSPATYDHLTFAPSAAIMGGEAIASSSA